MNTNFTGEVGHPDRPTDRPGYVPHLGGGASITHHSPVVLFVRFGSVAQLGSRPGNGAPLRARAASLFLPCERGLNSHTDVVTRPRLSLAL